MKIHIGVVSDQLLQNLIPVLIEKPDKVYLLSSDEMVNRGKAKTLTDELKKFGIDCVLHSEMPDADMRAIQDFSLRVAANIREAHPDAEITLNATGGTKLMSMGLVDVWRGEADKIIYVDTSHRRIEILPDSKGHVAPSIPMGNELDVPAYLRAQGFKYVKAASDDPAWRERVMNRKEVCKFLGRHAGSLTWLIGDINRMVNSAVEQTSEQGEKLEKLAAPKQSLSATPRGDSFAALQKMVAAALLKWEEGSQQIEFIDMERTRFLCGGWLEEYAWHVMRDEKLFDVRMSVNVADKQTRNEFDVLACHQNQLLFVECKTLRFSGLNDNEIAYKVDSLGQDARGLFGETWLLSARKPTGILVDRAKRARIRIVGPDELPRLRDIVREWMQ